MQIQWQSAPTIEAIRDFLQTHSRIHVWKFSLAITSELQEIFLKSFSEDEYVKADRFRYERDRNRFIAARGYMRQILGLYTNHAAGDLVFDYNPQGKPSLRGLTLEFNLSHSGDLGLLAIANDRIVGIDLEEIHPVSDLEKLAARFFTPGEHQRIMKTKGEERVQTFFRTWTCKEAYLKATGVGISKLKSLEIAIQPQQPASFINPQTWDVQEIVPETNFVGAIAAPDLDWRCEFFNSDYI
jgi:4'-phosphopantetheinyl transferase